MDSKAENRSILHVEAIKNVRVVLRILLIVIFLGILSLWIFGPTKISRDKWMPKYNAQANKSTYFEQQGAYLLLYTFPLLFAATIGCVYLCLGEKINEPQFHSNSKQSIIASWRQPVLVKGPLGIVSGLELAFFVMFLVLITWTLALRLPPSLQEYALWIPFGYNRWQASLSIVGGELGYAGYICLVLLFFPVTRGSSILPLFGLDYESCIKYHIWVGHTTMVLFTLHSITYIISWAAQNNLAKLLEWRPHHISNLAGVLSFLFGLVLWSTTYASIRRKMFELFLYTHYFYILFVVFFVYHVGMTTVFLVLPGMYLFIVDRFLRFLQSRERVGLVSARVLPCRTLELNFAKSSRLNYSPTSIMFINVPSISKLQWHPFTITSNSSMESDVISTLIKVDGDWTLKLHQMLSSPASSSIPLEFAVEGPYGPSSTKFFGYDTIVLVSGGSGIAPFISIIRELIFMIKTTKCASPYVFLIASFKYSDELSMLDLILPATGSLHDFRSLDIQIQAYVTRQKGPPTESANLHTKTIMFKTRPTDSAVSVIPGSRSWLWLGTIIASSFAIFLVLIGVITHYYIYPREHNNAKVFPYAIICTIYMLVILFSIAVATSLAYLRAKKQNAEEAKPAVPNSSPSSIVDRELESCLPPLKPLEAATVHYGERPNLKRIITEVKGKNVGVFVSGPKSLRADVADICSSGVAGNLSFQSISFSW